LITLCYSFLNKGCLRRIFPAPTSLKGVLRRTLLLLPHRGKEARGFFEAKEGLNKALLLKVISKMRSQKVPQNHASKRGV